MRRNCTDIKDYRIQAGTIKERLEEKGYDGDSLRKTMEQVEQIDRATLLQEGPGRNKEGPIIPFITSYSTQHYRIKNILRKHWHLLGNDRVIKTFIPEKPQIVFRGVPSLRDKIAPNVVDPPTKKI